MAQDSRVDLSLTRNFDDSVLDGVNAGNLEFCIRVTGEAKSLQHKQVTGLLRNSIQYEVSDGNKGGLNDGSGERADEIDISLKDGEAAFGASADYASYVEFGTRKSRPFPFMRPAIALIKGALPGEIAKKIIEETERGVLKRGQKRETFK